MRNFGFVIFSAIVLSVTGCSSMKKQPNGGSSSPTAKTGAVETEDKNKEAAEKASSLTAGWPESSVAAAKEIVAKYGEPQETTSTTLVWRNSAPFKRIIVHKELYSNKFPLLHQDSVEHVVDYRAPSSKVERVWKFDGSVVLDRTRGEMSARSENEAMNILALNLADEIMTGKRSAESARIQFGKETLSYLNGNKTALTQTVSFGQKFNTVDAGESVTNKIRWVGDKAPAKQPKSDLNLKQAEEAK